MVTNTNILSSTVCNSNAKADFNLQMYLCHVCHVCSFGIHHDGQGNDCELEGRHPFIMSRQLMYDSSPLTWSSCSKEYITRFLEYGLRRVPSHPPQTAMYQITNSYFLFIHWNDWNSNEIMNYFWIVIMTNNTWHAHKHLFCLLCYLFTYFHFILSTVSLYNSLFSL